MIIVITNVRAEIDSLDFIYVFTPRWWQPPFYLHLDTNSINHLTPQTGNTILTPDDLF